MNWRAASAPTSTTGSACSPCTCRRCGSGPTTGHFLDQARARLGLESVRLALATVQAMQAYPWPGNVRELEHAILRAALRAASDRGRSLVLEPGDLDIGPEARPDAEGGLAGISRALSLADAVDGVQRNLILETLQECNANWSEAARRLGLDRGNLHRLAKRLGIK